MANKIYIVAGERNMRLAPTEGGLYANVGQTTRDVAERLRDDDYKRKAAGGKWQVLLEQEVGDLTDKELHPLLKRHPGVTWDSSSDNTEEFFFRGDPGDGSIARQIVGVILKQICIPLLQRENSRLTGDIAQLGEEIAKRDEIIRSISSGEMLQSSLSRLADASKENDELKRENERLQQENTSFNIDRQAANRIKEENRCLRQWYEEGRQDYISVKSELDSLKVESAAVETTLQNTMKSLQVAVEERAALENEVTHLRDNSSKADKNYLERIDLLRQAVELKNVEAVTAKKELSDVRDAYTRRATQFDLLLEKTQSDLTRTRHELCDAHDNLNKMTLGATAAGVLAFLLLGIGCWKLWKTNDEIEQLQSQVAGYQEALTTETLKNNRLKLKLADASHSVGASSQAQGQKHKDRQALPPVPLNSDNRVRYNELYALLGKERADAYARGVAAVEKDRTGAASYAIQHSKPIDPDVNPDAAGVAILDAGVLVTLINEQVVSNATACLLLKTKSTSKYHVTASMGILPDGRVGHIKVQGQDGDPQLVAECILPALKGVQIDPPGVNLLGTYAADFNIKVTDE